MKQNKGVNGDLKPEHKKTTNKITMGSTTGNASLAPTFQDTLMRVSGAFPGYLHIFLLFVWATYFVFVFVSSPEHEVLKVSCCDRTMSVVRRASSVAHKSAYIG